MRVTSRWTKWALQEDDLQTGILQYKYGFSKLGSSSINMVFTTTQGAKSTNTATEAVRPFVLRSICQKKFTATLGDPWG